jgi:hypothetical protein
MDLNEAGATEVFSPSQKTPDSLGRIAAADPEVERSLATGHQPIVRELLWRVVHPTIDAKLHAAWRHAQVDGTPSQVQICFGGSDSAVYDVHAVPEGEGIALYCLAARRLPGLE